MHLRPSAYVLISDGAPLYGSGNHSLHVTSLNSLVIVVSCTMAHIEYR